MQNQLSQKQYAEKKLGIHDYEQNFPGLEPQSSKGLPFVREYRSFQGKSGEKTCVHKETKTEVLQQTLNTALQESLRKPHVKNTTVIKVYKQKTEPSESSFPLTDSSFDACQSISSLELDNEPPRLSPAINHHHRMPHRRARSVDRGLSDRRGHVQTSNKNSLRSTRDNTVSEFDCSRNFEHNSHDFRRDILEQQSYITTCFEDQNSEQKCFPCVFIGQIPVKTQMRNLSFHDRIRLAKLCHHVITTKTYSDESIQNFGEPNLKRTGECMNVSLKNKMELTTTSNVLIATHNPYDVSVVVSIETKPGCIVYIGRTDFAGRIGVVLTFVKEEHKLQVINFFKRNKMR